MRRGRIKFRSRLTRSCTFSRICSILRRRYAHALLPFSPAAHCCCPLQLPIAAAHCCCPLLLPIDAAHCCRPLLLPMPIVDAHCCCPLPSACHCCAECTVCVHLLYSIACEQRRIMLPHCAVLCCAVLCCAVLCCAVLCCAVLCCAVPDCICRKCKCHYVTVLKSLSFVIAQHQLQQLDHGVTGAVTTDLLSDWLSQIHS